MDETLKQLDALTKQGRRLAVLKALQAAVKSRPDAVYLPALARLANRNHAFLFALRILHPLVYEQGRDGARPASAEALTIYATSLHWMGALEEAKAHLEKVSGFTEALLTRAFVLFAQWDYASAVPFLLRYINSRDISDYQMLVGKVNLLAAQIALGRTTQAEGILEELKPKLSADPSTTILYGNCLELESQIRLQQGRLDSAGRVLSQAEEAFRDQPGRYLLFVKKWKAVLALTLSPTGAEARAGLLRVKAEALELRNWETLRDCDFHFARLTGEKQLLDRVLLGTPYPGFHDRVRDLYGLEPPQTRRMEYCPSRITDDVGSIGFDLERLEWRSFPNPTSWPLIQLLTRDIYRPPRIGVVFSALYPKEYFNPFSSPQRVRNSVFRFNDWAREKGLAFRVRNRRGDYFFEGPPGVGIGCASRARLVPDWEAALRIFGRENASRSFTVRELGETLEVAPRTALNILSEALRRNKVERIGRGKNTRYILFSGRRRSRRNQRKSAA